MNRVRERENSLKLCYNVILFMIIFLSAVFKLMLKSWRKKIHNKKISKGGGNGGVKNIILDSSGCCSLKIYIITYVFIKKKKKRNEEEDTL